MHSPALALRTLLAPLLAAPAEGTAGGGFSTIFPGPSGDTRGRQLEETWALLLDQLREPVDSTLRGGLSAGDIAYRLGELVHNYFRTRGVTLTSFELRRIVVALLDTYRRGWPHAGPPAAAAAVLAGGVTRSGSGSLVAFVDRDGSRPRPPPGSWNGDSAVLSPAVTTPDLPSSLVSVEPRDDGAGFGTPMHEADAEISIPPPPSVEAPRGPAEPLPGLPAALGVDEALATILPSLRQQRRSAPALSVPREVMPWLGGAIDAALAAQSIAVAAGDRDRLEHQAFEALFGLGPLEPLMRDESVSGIFVNGPGAVFLERRGRLEPARVTFRDAQQLAAVAEHLAERAGVAPASRREPLVDQRLEDGTRVIVVAPPLAPADPYLVIRRATTRTVTLDSLVAEGALSPQIAAVLRLAVRSRLNILVCGGPAVGKTALLAALARAVPAEDRIVTVECTPELRPEVAHHVPLLAADSGTAGVLAVQAALALRPDRLIVDGPTEAAMSTIAHAAAAGTDGIVASVMAMTPQSAVDRLEAMLRAADPAAPAIGSRRRLAHSFELVVQLERQRDGMRRATHIADIVIEGEAILCRDLVAFDAAAGRFVASGVRPSFMARVARAGLEGPLLDAL